MEFYLTDAERERLEKELPLKRDDPPYDIFNISNHDFFAPYRHHGFMMLNTFRYSYQPPPYDQFVRDDAIKLVSSWRKEAAKNQEDECQGGLF